MNPFKELNASLGGDWEETNTIVRLFFESAQEQLNNLNQALAQEDREQIAYAAHQFAGASGTCGLTELSGLLRELEHAAPQADWPQLAQQLNRIRDGVTAIRSQWDASQSNNAPT